MCFCVYVFPCSRVSEISLSPVLLNLTSAHHNRSPDDSDWLYHSSSFAAFPPRRSTLTTASTNIHTHRSHTLPPRHQSTPTSIQAVHSLSLFSAERRVTIYIFELSWDVFPVEFLAECRKRFTAVGHSLSLARWPSTLCPMSCATPPSTRQLSDDFWRHIFSRATRLAH